MADEPTEKQIEGLVAASRLIFTPMPGVDSFVDDVMQELGLDPEPEKETI